MMERRGVGQQALQVRAGADPVTRRSFVKALGVLGAACLCPGMLGGCAPKAEKRQAAAPQRIFVDSTGREVGLPVDVQGIVPSGAYAQVMLCMLCPEKLVGLSSSLSKKQIEFLPDIVSELPVLGRYYGKNADMNYENVISLAPDAIVDVGEQDSDMAEAMDGLQEQTGIPCLSIDASFANIATAYRMLGEALGVPERAERLASYVDEVTAFAAAHADEVAARDIGVLYSTGAYGYQVKEQGSVHSAALEFAGLRNVAELSDANATEVSPEQVMIWQPNVVLLSKEMGFFDQIYEDPTWATVKAVRERQVYEVPYQPYEWLDRPPSAQTVLGLQWVGNLLCPDIYDFDMIDRAREFYDLFWSYDLSQEDAADLLANSTLL